MRPLARTLGATALALAPLVGLAQAAPAAPALLRYDDDHGALARGCEARGPWACVKRRALGDGLRLSVGGEWSMRLEVQRDPRFGSAFTGVDATALQRAFAFADVDAGEHWRAFVQLSGTAAQGRRGGVTPVDRTGIEWQNAFLEWRTTDAASGLRGGHQELRFGSGRLIDAREGLNARLGFSGFRGWASPGGWRIDALDVRPRVKRPGRLNDQRADAERLRGLYAQRGAGAAFVGAYALWRESPAVLGGEGRREETRRTLGAQHVGAWRGWEWNIEAMQQRGDATGAPIRAHALFVEGDFGVEGWPGGLRLGALAGVASGDDAIGDGLVGTFDPLYARGNLLDEDATLFPRNLRNLQATAEFFPAPGWFVQASAGTLWRDSLADGLYRPGGAALVASGGSRERRVATTASGFAERRWANGWSLMLRGAVLVPGPFLEQRGLDDTSLWGEAALRYRF